MTTPLHTLNDGRQLPAVGLGTVGLRHEEGVASMVTALQSGYRLLDSAMNYNNEKEVGEAVRTSGIDRDEIVVTTKLPGRHHGYDATLASAEESLGNLGLDRIDLYLIHWPNPSRDLFVESWRAMVELRDRGVVRSIGVSNFTPEFLARIIEATEVVPAVNQIELHPHFPQGDQRGVDASRGIRTESWSPLGQKGALRSDATIAGIADRHGVTPTQVVLRWHTQLGAVPIPKSGDPDRQRENLDIFGFELTTDDLDSISALETGRLWNGDPRIHEEM